MPTNVAVARLLGVLVLGLVLRNVMAYLTAQLLVSVQEGMVRDLRSALFSHLLRLDLGYFQRTRQGHILSSMTTEVDQMKEVVTAALVRLFQSIVKIATVLLLMSQISGRLMLLTLTTAPAPGAGAPVGAGPPQGARARPDRGPGGHHGDGQRADRGRQADPGLR